MFSRANIFPKKHKNFFSKFSQYNRFSKALIVTLTIFYPINLIIQIHWMILIITKIKKLKVKKQIISQKRRLHFRSRGYD